jgi:ADP-heptose:LPS heptosyltransferase
VLIYTPIVALRRNILLFHQGALGDFIVTWPLALGLARVFAQSRVFYVTSGQKGAVAEKVLRVDAADVESGWHHLFSPDPKLPEPAERLLAGAQWVVNFVSRPEDLWAQNVRALAPEAHLVTISTTMPDDFAGHVTEYMLTQLKGQPVVEAALSQMLRSVAARGVGCPRPAGGPVVLHPGAGSDTKCWPADSFLELAQRLTHSGASVEVLLGEVELEKWPAERVRWFKDIAAVRAPATLLELCAHISGGSAFVGNDSGPGHLAASIGVPTVSIFGPKDSTRWRPIGPDVRVVAGEWVNITVERIMTELRRR